MMNEQDQILEYYLKGKFGDKENLTITRLEKLCDGWESDNYIFTIEYGSNQRICEELVWRIYSGAGNQAKAAWEFNSMQKLHRADYPVPRVFLLETDNSPVDRPFIMMEFVQGDDMWDLLDKASAEKQTELIDQFCRLFVQLHTMDWRKFDDSLPVSDPYFFIDRWLNEVCRVLENFPEVDASPFLDWVTARRTHLACARPSPVHQDFHPGNILVSVNDGATVIDWTGFDVTDPRFDLAWTLVLAHAYGWPGSRNQILQGYERNAGKPVEEIETFEVIACARRLLDLTISLTQGAEQMGMNVQATEAMRNSMEAHRRVHRRFIELTGLQIKTFDDLFGKSE